ncbi:hypothetical protein HYALB_00009883 [Hymenoscyphus albidus]|uniref:Uncharacterized protein n=1 Tax=Hymenoscyphus albidus TaxID=595503 RepID=A0A9N9Q2M8_9HELO|nr:hypothetical protein HYALB_00009883 [Hymenoscyphus albidus]
MIKLMRAKVVEGIEQRKGLSAQLHRIHMAVESRYLKNLASSFLINETDQGTSRNTHVQAAQANHRLSSDQGSRRGNDAGARGEEDQMSFSSSPCSTTSKSSKTSRPTLPSLNSLNFAPGPTGALFEPRATRPAVPRELQLCEKYKAKPIEYT